VAEALAELGAEFALVLHSDDGLDELSVTAPTTVIEVRDGAVFGTWMVDPADLGICADDPDSLRGGDVEENARRLCAILDGEERSAASEAVALNAAAALMVGAKVDDLATGLRLARELIAGGAAGRKLEALVRRSQELGNG
jgi:anthranilate phosphoribosyltransferase